MTLEQIIQFRTNFQSIVYLNSVIITQNLKLRQLHAWDKNDSHKDAILRNIEERKTMKAKLDKLLEGKTYEEWKIFSKRLSVLNNRFSNSARTMKKAEQEISELKF